MRSALRPIATTSGARNVREGWVSRSKGFDDRDNPHRWWNTTGDWKAAAGAASPTGLDG